jgi:hypothetical protein
MSDGLSHSLGVLAQNSAPPKKTLASREVIRARSRYASTDRAHISPTFAFLCVTMGSFRARTPKRVPPPSKFSGIVVALRQLLGDLLRDQGARLLSANKPTWIKPFDLNPLMTRRSVDQDFLMLPGKQLKVANLKIV